MSNTSVNTDNAVRKEDVAGSLELIALKKKGKRNLRLNTAPLHIMLFPAVIMTLIYSYGPMLGVIIAFQNFDVLKVNGGFFNIFFGSPWAENNGFEHFLRIFEDTEAIRAIRNTLIIAISKIITMFFSPIILSLLLNEVRNRFVARTVQTVVYLPHFLSWVILAGIIVQVLSSTGVVNSVIKMIMGENYPSIMFLQKPEWFRTIIVVTNIWKEIGWSTIVYLAAISGVDPTLYEAAIMDGATKLKQCWHITLPGMKPIIVLNLVLSLQGIMGAGFDQIFNLYNVQTYETGDVIDTFVYRISFQQSQFSLGAAIGLMNSVIALSLISISYTLANKLANYRVF